MTYKTSLIVLSAFGGLFMAMLAAAALSTPIETASAAHHENNTATTTQIQSSNGSFVSVGKGNLTVSYNQFYPQTLEINAGESVSFTNPTPELHSVIFDLSNGTIISDTVLPFTVSGSPEFTLDPPFNLGEPILKTDENGTQTLVTLNKVVFLPSVVDELGTIEELNGTDVSYVATGNEQAISSGIIMPTDEELEAMFMAAFPEEMMTEEQDATNTNATEAGAEEEEFERPVQNVNRFSVTFEQPGTYEFFCPFHPAMYGQITVK